MYAKPVAGNIAIPSPEPRRRAVHTITVGSGLRVLTKLVEDAPEVYVASVTMNTARQLLINQRAGQALGGIARTASGWAPVAYTDRNHLLNGTGPVEYLDDVATLAEAAEALIRYWQGR